MRYISVLLCVILPGCVLPTTGLDPASLIAIEGALADLGPNANILSNHHARERAKAKPLDVVTWSDPEDAPSSVPNNVSAEPVSDETSSSPYVLRGRRRGFFTKKYKTQPQPNYNFTPPLR